MKNTSVSASIMLSTVPFQPRHNTSLLWLIIVPLLFVFGCATSYQKADPTWGFFDKQLDERRYLVAFQGNGFTEHSKLVAAFMYRCVELTEELGSDHFVIENPSLSSSNSASASPNDGPRAGRIQLDLVPGSGSTVRGIVSFKKGPPPQSDPYAFDPRSLRTGLEKLLK
jgi:hypothetical protein